MNIDKDSSEINFTDINWDNLSEEKYHELSERLINKIKEVKKPATKSKMVTVKIDNNLYSIPEHLFNRIKTANSPELKHKLKADVVNNYQPLKQI